MQSFTALTARKRARLRETTEDQSIHAGDIQCFLKTAATLNISGSHTQTYKRWKRGIAESTKQHWPVDAPQAQARTKQCKANDTGDQLLRRVAGRCSADTGTHSNTTPPGMARELTSPREDASLSKTLASARPPASCNLTSSKKQPRKISSTRHVEK